MDSPTFLHLVYYIVKKGTIQLTRTLPVPGSLDIKSEKKIQSLFNKKSSIFSIKLSNEPGTVIQNNGGTYTMLNVLLSSNNPPNDSDTKISFDHCLELAKNRWINQFLQYQ
jgi:hypothetical protein